MNDGEAFERCVAAGGVALFPSDTVYGLACDPDDRFAVERLYLLKRRTLEKPSAVMFFSLERAFAALPELGERTRNAMARLLPGAVSVLVSNPAGRYALACGNDVRTLGVRVPVIPALAQVRRAVLQSSANRAGGADPRSLDEVPVFLRSAVDLVIDGGELPGTPSTVVDLRRYEIEGEWNVVRVGAVGERELTEALHWQYHFDADSYADEIRADLPAYDALQDELAGATGSGARRILELGTGTGETARRLLARHPDAVLVGIDENERMLAVAGEALPGDRVDLRAGRIEDTLPDGLFDVVASALCVHHLSGLAKADLFRRVRDVLAPGGLFVMGDVVVPDDPSLATTPLTPGYDSPSPLAVQVRWLDEAGFEPRVVWEEGDLAVVAARRN
ncbi:MAG TPA: Sua5/YciO/YrdC/YwlC family protein [Solirubrobacteraceae bacterium]|nr:Sua5/YciO/YrdC/YwlC family protein [Solirubrobacteraceae bacterium]